MPSQQTSNPMPRVKLPGNQLSEQFTLYRPVIAWGFRQQFRNRHGRDISQLPWFQLVESSAIDSTLTYHCLRADLVQVFPEFPHQRRSGRKLSGAVPAYRDCEPVGSAPARQRCSPPGGSAWCVSCGNAWREAYTAGGGAALSSLEIINVGAFSVQRLGAAPEAPPRARRNGPTGVGARGDSRSCGENGQTHGLQGGIEARFAVCAHEQQVRQGPVRQVVSDSSGTTWGAKAHGRRGGSDPPENGPRLYSRAFRRGRSRDCSLQEGRVCPKGPGRRSPRTSGPS